MAIAFHPLRISDVRRETPEAVSIAFAVPAELSEDYRFTPGQHLTLRTHLNGEEVRRSYSICVAPHEGELRVAVKKVEGGLFPGMKGGYVLYRVDSFDPAAGGHTSVRRRFSDFVVRRLLRGALAKYTSSAASLGDTARPPALWGGVCISRHQSCAQPTPTHDCTLTD